MRRHPCALLVLAAGLSACSDASPARPSAPVPIATPPTAPPVTPLGNEAWAVSGRVVATTTGRALGGVRIASEVGVSTTSGDDGTFRLGSETNPPFTPHRFTLDHPEHVPREVYLTWQRGLREHITVDLIPLAQPFSVAFYKALVRNGYEQPGGLQTVRRWTSNPSVYVRSADQHGRPIEPEVMALVLATIPRAVSEWTAGRLAVAQFESGAETRPEASGWITVNITRNYQSDFCGQARVGGNPGLITLVNDRCNCGSVKIGADVVVHEVGHALGFWHVGERGAVMYPQASGGCPAGTLTSAERFHANLAYQRPPGNADPDRDPNTAGFLLGADDPPPVITCFRSARR